MRRGERRRIMKERRKIWKRLSGGGKDECEEGWEGGESGEEGEGGKGEGGKGEGGGKKENEE